MMLCVVGDVDPEQVISMAERILPRERRPLPQRDYGPAEAPGCTTPCTRRQMDVAMPTFQLGFPCPWPGFGPAGARQELVGDLAAEALMGESSRLYLEPVSYTHLDVYVNGKFVDSFKVDFSAASGEKITLRFTVDG